ncbi:ribosome recycling factor [Halorhodospira halochloris]|uniref:Ribosome-recycling factor n=1 Tax=Halorhodospira halochloris TaxID=1052 RepID=A0A0X8X9C1_HALHR|nr:ribosome recycling factor [Halorhodospira halochloris]MBK1651180.1 ribosome recycling factor [Halorhodospira halochloris]MCG5531077.1 ribosome recycling factor [Halorhodospira halochloris]MCG5547675.1 ribosome recycling factor [Halorhodospira halochloris]BAU57452.1 ribosome recycling factor [Halorhodospira halochloris]
MIDDIKEDAEKRMAKAVDSLNHDLARLRTGRAHTSLLDQVMVDYYGTQVPVKQAANVSVEDARTLSVTPWEKSMVPVIEKAIMASNLGLSPVTSGQTIRVPLPSLTEERRKEMVRLVKNEAEQARVAIRNVRRDANSDLKDLAKNKDITEDDERSGQEAIQKLTDKYVSKVDSVLEEKERELMEI